MARNGAGVYSKPAGTTPVDGDNIDAAPFNLLMDDIATDLNTVRPIVAGGTGAANAPAALIALGLTATAAELNFVDGVTSAIQTQFGAATTANNLKANIASPTFTGVPAAPTASAATNTTQLATTAFVTTADNLKANIASPTFTGIPAAPTATTGTSTTQLATTAFATTTVNLKANIASPTFTGVPAADTAPPATNTTQLATTAFVMAAVPSTATQSQAVWDAGSSTAESTITARKLTDKTKADFSVTGDAPMFACRAWVTFDGTGTPAIGGSGNVSSITDLGVGNYRITFTIAMPISNYCYTHAYSDEINVQAGVGFHGGGNISSLEVKHYNAANAANTVDKRRVAIAIFC